MTNTFYYFAYGMNTDPAIMARHDYCKPMGMARLDGWHLAFKFHVTLSPGGETYGVLWEINQATLDSIDSQEGYPSYYSRQLISVEFEDRRCISHVYMMIPPVSKFNLGPSPSDAYLKHVINGYKTFNLPLSQVEKALAISSELCYAG